MNISAIFTTIKKISPPTLLQGKKIARTSAVNFCDAFEKQDKFVPFNKLYPREITPEWFKSLSKNDLEKYEQEYQSYIHYLSLGETRYFTDYTKYLQEGLEKISAGKPYKFIAIGQSPALFAKIMQINGKDAGICPISELGKCVDEKIINNIAQNSDKYFNYLKKFNVDLENIDKNKNYIFSDFTVSGASLKNFREILKAKGICGENIHFLSLDSILNKANIPAENKNAMLEVHNYYLYMSNLKNRFSPIFKLPLSKLNDIDAIEQYHQGSEANKAANIMLYHLLKKIN